MYVWRSEWQWSVLLRIEFFGDYRRKVENLECIKAPQSVCIEKEATFWAPERICEQRHVQILSGGK